MNETSGFVSGSKTTGAIQCYSVRTHSNNTRLNQVSGTSVERAVGSWARKGAAELCRNTVKIVRKIVMKWERRNKACKLRFGAVLVQSEHSDILSKYSPISHPVILNFAFELQTRYSTRLHTVSEPQSPIVTIARSP